MTAELVLQRDLSAPPERVWRALTDPAALAAWFWPPRLEPAAEVDLAVGGGSGSTAQGRDRRLRAVPRARPRRTGWPAPGAGTGRTPRRWSRSS